MLYCRSVVCNTIWSILWGNDNPIDILNTFIAVQFSFVIITFIIVTY